MGFFDRFRSTEPLPLTEIQQAQQNMLAARTAARVRIMEATTDLYSNCVDLNEPFYGCGSDGLQNGEIWRNACHTNQDDASTDMTSEEWLNGVRRMARQLADTNEYAICGHENRINYIVGQGHEYTVTAAPDIDKVADETIDAVQAVVDQFITDSKWSARQQEIVRRKDRDGECFLRFFVDSELGELSIRFVEPGQVSTPQGDMRENATFGIVTAEDDVETIEEYYVDGKLVPAIDIQHRKENVDSTVKRGLPLFYPVAPNLRRVEKLLRNMTTLAEIQAAIAMIRHHEGAGAGSQTVSDTIANGADVSVTHGSNPTRYFKRYGPGTILDAPTSSTYEFPTAGIESGKLVIVIQAELRAVASRLVMPEFMLTSDASNANYSSTLVAEGPAVKMFQRWQSDLIDEDLEVFDRVLDLAVVAGQISQEQREQVAIDVTPPNVVTRDRKAETEADILLVNAKAMSIETLQLRNDLDPQHETELIDAQREKMDPFDGMDPLQMMRGQPGAQQQPSGQEDEGDDDENGD